MSWFAKEMQLCGVVVQVHENSLGIDLHRQVGRRVGKIRLRDHLWGGFLYFLLFVVEALLRYLLFFWLFCLGFLSKSKFIMFVVEVFRIRVAFVSLLLLFLLPTCAHFHLLFRFIY